MEGVGGVCLVGAPWVMQMSSHTPGKWEVGLQTGPLPITPPYVVVASPQAPAKPGKLKIVALCGAAGGEYADMSLADAELIARAVNSLELHQRAVEALRKADEELMDLFHALSDEQQQQYGPTHAMLMGEIGSVLAALEQET